MSHWKKGDVAILFGVICVSAVVTFNAAAPRRVGAGAVFSRQMPCVNSVVAPVHLPAMQNTISRRDVSAAAKGKQTMRRGGEPGRVMRNIPPTPPVDPQNEEFVIFVRSRMQRTWLPMSMVKGGWQANAIIAQQRNEFGKNLFGKTLDDTLTRNIATAIYQDKGKLEQRLRQQIPQLKSTKVFEYGYKIRDRDEPDNWYKAEGITKIPAEEDIPKTPLDNIGDWFQGNLGKIGGGFGK